MNKVESIIMILALVLSVGIVLYVIIKTVKTIRIKKYGVYLEATIVKVEKVDSRVGVICKVRYEFEYNGKKIVKIEPANILKDYDFRDEEVIGQKINVYYHPKYNVAIDEGIYKQVLMRSVLFGVLFQVLIIFLTLIFLNKFVLLEIMTAITIGILTIIYSFYKLNKFIAIKKYGKLLEATVVNIEKEVKSYYVNCEIEFNGKTIQRCHRGLRKRDIDCKNISIGDKCDVYFNPKYNCVLIEQLYKIELQSWSFMIFATSVIALLYVLCKLVIYGIR